MIDWNKVEDDISALIQGTRHRSAIASAMIVRDYVKSLIAKEFKLVARGKITIKNGITTLSLPSGLEDLAKRLRDDYEDKPISIYISENEGGINGRIYKNRKNKNIL